VGLFVRRFVLIAFIASALIVGPTAALDATRTVHQLTHTAWGVRDDGPVDTWSFAQTPDGLLWIASTDGLLTFDGVTFRRPRDENGEAILSGENINNLFVSSDGDLWTGSSTGSIARLRGGRLTRHPTPSGHIVSKFAEDADGALWAAFGGGAGSLLRFDGEAWREAPFGWPRPGGRLSDLLLTRDGVLLVAVEDTIVFLRRGSQRFEETGVILPTFARLAEGSDGRLWIAVGQFGLASIDIEALINRGPARWRLPAPDVRVRPRRIMFDSDGVLWTSSWDEGLFRVHVESDGELRSIERFRASDGLTSDQASILFEDRESNIWVGTHLGIDRFRPASIVAERSIAEVSRSGHGAVDVDPQTALLATATELYVIREDAPPRLFARLDDQIVAICGHERHGAWVATRNGELRHFTQGRLVLARAPPTQATVLSCAIDEAGSVWLTAEGEGVFKLTAGEWRRHPPHPELATAVGQIAPNENDGVWFSEFYSDEPRLALVGPEHAQVFGGSSGARIGQIQVVDPRPGYVLFGGARGLARFDGRSFARLESDRHDLLSGVSGIAQASDGSTWLASLRGVLRIEERDLQFAFAHPDAPLRGRIFDLRDGLPAGAVQDSLSNAIVEGPDGRLWLMTKDGVAWVDPLRLAFNGLAPPVSVTALRAGGRTIPFLGQVTLAPGTSDIEIDYAALSLQMPERVVYRYVLEGVDPDWIEAGTRRQAFYTELGPGEYRFRVIAANNDGVWNEEGATLTFTIRPTFIQSIWFKFLVALALFALVILAYAFRVQQVTAQLQSRFDVRIAERERIARELHDTLLQGFQGLLLRFQAIANRVPAGDELRGSLDQALDRADAVLVEGRARVRELRTAAAEGDLAKVIVENAHGVIEGDTPRFQLTVEGSPQALHALVSEEVARIAEEAVRNAVQHADAKTIEAILTYGGSELRMTIRDDGLGMPQSILTTGEKAGHYGLVGMRERAQRLGGRLDVTSRERAGTEIALSVPGRAAYKDRRARFFDGLWAIGPGSSA
jgi:signal transduction histidine kinase/ligand-binding sensor domain-containing protein